DLWATVLVTADQHEMAAFVDLDLNLVTMEGAQAVRAEVARVLQVAPEKVRVSESHNHAGPSPSTWAWMEQGTAAVKRDDEQLPDLAAGAAGRALARLRRARVAAGAGESRVAVNRREAAPNGRMVTGVDPGGVMDPQVFVLRIDGQDGSPLASVVG